MVLELDSIEQESTWQRFMAQEGTDQDGRTASDAATPVGWSAVGPPLPAAFAGQVRLPYLYGNRLVVTDAQVFDGVLLLAAGPTGVAELLGSMHRSDIMVMLRCASARESLEAMLAGPNFLSSAEKTGWDVSTIDALREDWVKAIDHHRVASAPFRDIAFKEELKGRLTKDPPPSLQDSDLIPALVEMSKRSDAMTAVEESGLDKAQQRVIFDWWNGAYMDVLALQHGSVWITTLYPGAARAEQGGTPATALPIPEVIVDLLSSISGAEFATLVADAEPVLAKLRSRKRLIDRLRLALLVLDVGSTPQPLIEFVALAARIATFALLIVSAILGSGGLVGLPSWLAIVIAVLLIAAQLPFLDIIRFLRLFRRSSRAIMRTPGWLDE